MHPGSAAMTSSALTRLTLLLALTTASGWFTQAQPAVAASPLQGRWQFDAARSTDLSPWRTLELEFSVDGPHVILRRSFGWGRRTFSEVLTLDLSRDVNVVPVTMWPDNRHLGAYAGGDRLKRVRASWLKEDRLLRLSSDLTLDTQQGERVVNILSDYKVSANGAVLTLTELRSTRNRPVVYTFIRPAAPTP